MISKNKIFSLLNISKSLLLIFFVLISFFSGGVKVKASGPSFDCPAGTFMTSIYFPRGGLDNQDTMDVSGTCAPATVTGVSAGNSEGASYGYNCPSGIMSGVYFPRAWWDNQGAQNNSATCYGAKTANPVSATAVQNYYTWNDVLITCPAGTFMQEMYYPRAGQDNASVVWGTITCVEMAKVNIASCHSISAPFSIVAGQTFQPSIVMTNDGTTDWTQGAYSLGSQNPENNNTWGLGRVPWSLTNSVSPGSSAIFAPSLTAPSTPGTYSFSWRMLQENVEWFGDTCAQSITVTPVVVAKPTGHISASPNPCNMTGSQVNCSSVISWDTSDTPSATVTISPNNALFANAVKGPQTAPWISQTPTIFTLKDSGGNVLDSVSVQGNPGTCSANGTNSWTSSTFTGNSSAGPCKASVNLSNIPVGQTQTTTNDQTLAPNYTGSVSFKCQIGNSWVGPSNMSCGCANGLDIATYPSCTCSLGKVPSGSSCVPTSISATITVDKTPIENGSSATLTLDSLGATSCNLSGIDPNITPNQKVTKSTGNLTSSQQYAFGCSNTNNSTSTGWQYLTVNVCAQDQTVVNGVCTNPNVNPVTPATNPLSGTITSSSQSCTIDTDQSSCNVNLSWSTTNPVGTSAITRNNPSGTVFTGNNSGPQSASVSGTYSNTTYYLYNNAVLLDQVTITPTCTFGSIWNAISGKCVSIINLAICTIAPSTSGCPCPSGYSGSQPICIIPLTTQTCSDGSVIPLSQSCPVPVDNTPVVIPHVIPSCPNGLDIAFYPSCSCPSFNHPNGGSCTIDTQTCWNGDEIPVTSSCPPEFKTCWDQSSVRVTQSCPPHITSLTATPQTIDQGQSTTLSWIIEGTNNTCGLSASSPFPNPTSAQIAEIAQINQKINTETIDNSTTVGINKAITTPSGGTATGKKSFNLNHSTVFDLHCSNSSQGRKIRINIANVFEG